MANSIAKFLAHVSFQSLRTISLGVSNSIEVVNRYSVDINLTCRGVTYVFQIPRCVNDVDVGYILVPNSD